jgi:hypothetical protein
MPQADFDASLPLRHTSRGLMIVQGAMVAMVVSLLAMSIGGGSRSLGKPNEFGDTTSILGPAVFWIATVISLAGKLQVRLDRRRPAEGRNLDGSIAAGLIPLGILASLKWLPNPGVVYMAAATCVPVSFLFFARFLRGFCERFDRPDLVARAGRLLRFSTGVLAVALFGFGLLWLDALLGSLFILAAYLAGGVAALWYAGLLSALRRLI